MGLYYFAVIQKLFHSVLTVLPRRLQCAQAASWSGRQQSGMPWRSGKLHQRPHLLAAVVQGRQPVLLSAGSAPLAGLPEPVAGSLHSNSKAEQQSLCTHHELHFFRQKLVTAGLRSESPASRLGESARELVEVLHAVQASLICLDSCSRSARPLASAAPAACLLGPHSSSPTVRLTKQPTSSAASCTSHHSFQSQDSFDLSAIRHPMHTHSSNFSTSHVPTCYFPKAQIYMYIRQATELLDDNFEERLACSWRCGSSCSKPPSRSEVSVLLVSAICTSSCPASPATTCAKLVLPTAHKAHLRILPQEIALTVLLLPARQNCI